MMVLMQMLGKLEHFAVLTALLISPHQATSCMSSSRLMVLGLKRDLKQDLGPMGHRHANQS